MERTEEAILNEERETLIDRLRKVDLSAIRERATRRAEAEESTEQSGQSWQQLTLGPAPWADGDDEVDPGDISLVTALSTHLLAQYIADHAKGERQTRMRKVIERQGESIQTLMAEAGLDAFAPDDLLLHLIDSWPRADRLRLLIDLNFTDPFFPYELSVSAEALEGGLRWIARHIGMGDDAIDSIFETRRSAERAHTKNRVIKIVASGAGGLVLLGAGGWALAPIIGGAIGAGAGLSGAAATAHGLALLGGGSLAAGGAGMAGGMFLVAGTGAAVGTVGGGGAAFLLGVGAKQARLELVRMQVTYRMTLLGEQIQTAKAAAVVKNLHGQIAEVEALLEDERDLNDKNSKRLDDLAKKVTTMRNAASWMTEQAEEQAS